MSRQHPCPACRNAQHDINANKTLCFLCVDTGTVGEFDVQWYELHLEDFCECGNPSKKTHYYADGENQRFNLAHYRCGDCGGIAKS